MSVKSMLWVMALGRLGPNRVGAAKFDSLVDDYACPPLVSVEYEAVDANFFISLSSR
jgi:hypothetical protein